MVRYPRELERRVRLRDGAEVTIRPIRPADREIEQAFVQGLSRESRYFRFLDTLKQLSPQMLQHFTDIDYDRHMALIALDCSAGSEQEIGVTRYVVTDSSETCEFAIVVADAWQRRGLGQVLMRCLTEVARSRGLKTMYGEVLAGNHAMLRFMRGLGFRAEPSPEDPKLRRLVFDLQAADDSSSVVTPAS